MNSASLPMLFFIQLKVLYISVTFSRLFRWGFCVQLIAQIVLLSPAKYSAKLSKLFVQHLCSTFYIFDGACSEYFGDRVGTRTLTNTHTHTYTHWEGGTRHRIYLCCIFVAAVLAGFVNRKIDFIYVCVY